MPAPMVVRNHLFYLTLFEAYVLDSHENASNKGHNGTTNGKNLNVTVQDDKATDEEVPQVPTKPSKKRKAAQRAEQNLAMVPASQLKDDSDPEDQDYIVESPDEEENPKRAKLDVSSDEEEDWSRQTLEQRLSDILAGGVFYDDSGEDEHEDRDSEDDALNLTGVGDDDEDDTEVEVSDSDDETGRIDLDMDELDTSDDSSDDEVEDSDEIGVSFSDDEFDDTALFESDMDDEEIMSYDEDRLPNSDDEIDDVISTIRPKEDEMGLLDDLYDAGYHGASDDSEDSIVGPVDDLEELAEHDEDDLYAEDSDAGDDLGGFIAAEGDINDEDDSDEDEGDHDDDDDDGDMDIDLGDDEYTDISPMYQMTTDHDFSIEGYRTIKNNPFILKLERTTSAKSRSGAFTAFKFGQIPDTHSVQVAMDAFNWMITPIEREDFFKFVFISILKQ